MPWEPLSSKSSCAKRIRRALSKAWSVMIGAGVETVMTVPTSLLGVGIPPPPSVDVGRGVTYAFQALRRLLVKLSMTLAVWVVARWGKEARVDKTLIVAWRGWVIGGRT